MFLFPTFLLGKSIIINRYFFQVNQIFFGNTLICFLCPADFIVEVIIILLQLMIALVQNFASQSFFTSVVLQYSHSAVVAGRLGTAISGVVA